MKRAFDVCFPEPDQAMITCEIVLTESGAQGESRCASDRSDGINWNIISGIIQVMMVTKRGFVAVEAICVLSRGIMNSSETCWWGEGDPW